MLVPVSNYVLIRRLESEKETAGGIVLPDTAQKKIWRGTVLAVGPGKYAADGRFLPVLAYPHGGQPVAAVKVGDVVLYGEFSGHKVEDEGEELTMLEEGDILALVVDSPPAQS